MMVGPFRECRCTIFVSIETVGSIRHEPLLVGAEERFERLSFHHRCTILHEKVGEVCPFDAVHSLIINLRQSVKFFLQLGILVYQFLVFQLRQRRKVGILWMQGINADAVIRIRICPRMRYSGVVYRQKLKNTLTCHGHPVYHLLQITEITHAETCLTSYREQWYDSACALPLINWERSYR